MRSSSPPRSVHIIPGELDTTVVATRLLVPTLTRPTWSPFRRVAESIANRARQLPTHAHEREEVLTYITEGHASYQLENGTIDPLPAGSGRLLTSPGRVSHRISPAESGPIRWFNLVLALPPTSTGPPQLQSMDHRAPTVEEDTVIVRRIVGPRAPMGSSSGFECEELRFATEGTTFRKVGSDRRAVFYATSGRGSVDQKDIEVGEAALIEGMSGIAVQGSDGFGGILATAPG
jgi:redox-sensitive bicupin YhaK (pirin superfamily)